MPENASSSMMSLGRRFGAVAQDSGAGAARWNIRYWHEADMLHALTNVRFGAQSGH
jgi:hypothetical protein